MPGPGFAGSVRGRAAGRRTLQSCQGGKGEGVRGWAGLCRLMQSVVERNGETRALFPALLWVFLAASGELRLPVQPRVEEDA